MPLGTGVVAGTQGDSILQEVFPWFRHFVIRRRPGGRPLCSAPAWQRLLLGGCSSFQPPQPWEKGTLARKDMTFEADPLDQRFVQHIYFSKEAASGGYGVGGGGCGCN
jgi:hypothetical protein